MTDVRQQLTEALDEAERLAREAADGDSGRWFFGDHWNVFRAEDTNPHGDEVNELVVYGNVKPQSEHIARWCPATVLRLAERDRSLIADFDAVVDVDIAWAKTELLHAEMARAVAFWVGTPEAECLVSIDIAPDSHIHVCGARGAHTDHQCRQCRMAWSRTTGTPEVDR